MRLRMGLAAVALAAMAAPAMADTCNEPVAPVISVVGATATIQQMRDAIADFKIYQKGADDFQDCVDAQIKALQEAAKNSKDGKPADPSVISGLLSRSTALQAEKEKIGGQLNVQIVAYKQAHPAPAKTQN